jgi:hypothetical protein
LNSVTTRTDRRGSSLARAAILAIVIVRRIQAMTERLAADRATTLAAVAGAASVTDPAIIETSTDSLPSMDSGVLLPASAAGASAQAPHVPSTGSTRPAHPRATSFVWVVGLLGLGVLAATVTALRPGNLGIPGATQDAVIFGRLVGAVLVGLGVLFVIDRARRWSGRRPFGSIWALPIAAVAMLLPLGVPAAAPGGTPTPGVRTAAVYARVVAPYSITPTTSADAALVSRVHTKVGDGDVTDAVVVRVASPGHPFIGYVIVLFRADRSGDPQGGLTEMLNALARQSLSPDVTTIDGRSVALFSVNGDWAAPWADGPFYVEVDAADRFSASSIATAVLGAQ